MIGATVIRRPPTAALSSTAWSYALTGIVVMILRIARRDLRDSKLAKHGVTTHLPNAIAPRLPAPSGLPLVVIILTHMALLGL